MSIISANPNLFNNGPIQFNSRSLGGSSLSKRTGPSTDFGGPDKPDNPVHILFSAFPPTIFLLVVTKPVSYLILVNCVYIWGLRSCSQLPMLDTAPHCTYVHVPTRLHAVDSDQATRHGPSKNRDHDYSCLSLPFPCVFPRYSRGNLQ